MAAAKTLLNNLKGLRRHYTEKSTFQYAYLEALEERLKKGKTDNDVICTYLGYQLPDLWKQLKLISVATGVQPKFAGKDYKKIQEAYDEQLEKDWLENKDPKKKDKLEDQLMQINVIDFELKQLEKYKKENKDTARYMSFGDNYYHGGWDNYYNDAGYERIAQSLKYDGGNGYHQPLGISRGGTAAYIDSGNLYYDEDDDDGGFDDDYYFVFEDKYNDNMNDMDGDDYYYHYHGFDDSDKASAKLDGYDYNNDAYGRFGNYYGSKANELRNSHRNARHRYGHRQLIEDNDNYNNMNSDSELILKLLLFVGFIGLIWWWMIAIYRYKISKNTSDERYHGAPMQITNDDGEDQV